MAQNNLDAKTLENWLWEAACKINGLKLLKNLQILGNI
ncbi:MAG: N-6 DNA methylase [Petrotoga mobilis]|nr:MAG: N-6 DNA methylase [Petrotoga mobilis]